MKTAKYGVLVLCALLFAANSFAVTTSIFYNKGVITIQQPDVGINKIYGVRLSPQSVNVKSSDKEIYLPVLIENMGNDTNVVRISIDIVSPGSGWEAELIADPDSDASHQSWEDQGIGPDVKLAEGALVRFFLKLKRSDSVAKGSMAEVLIKASCRTKSVKSYTGDNGLIYGGDEEVVCKNTIVVE